MINFRDIVEEAKVVEAAPRYFGLGFIQITLGTGRYHFYCKDLDPTLGDEEVHNHRYNFRSTVMKGSLENQLFVASSFPSESGDWEMAEVACKPGHTEMKAPVVGYSLIKVNTFDTNEGSSYYMHHDTFHRVKPLTSYTITRLARSPYKKDVAQVVRPIASVVVCPYETPLVEDDCWKWIKKAIES